MKKCGRKKNDGKCYKGKGTCLRPACGVQEIIPMKEPSVHTDEGTECP